MHVAYQDAVLDQRGILGLDALIIHIDGQGSGPAEGSMGKVRHRDQLACHPLIQHRARDRAAQHQISLNGVADGLVGQHAGQIAAQDDRLAAGIGVYAFRLAHDQLIQLVHALMRQGGVCKVAVKAAQTADGLKDLNRRAVFALGGQEDVDIAARLQAVAEKAVRSEQKLFHAVVIGDQGAALKGRVLGLDVAVQPLQVIDVVFLRQVRVLRQVPLAALEDFGQAARAAPRVAGQQLGVVGGVLQHAPDRLVAQVGGGGEAIDAVAVGARAYAAGIRALVAGQAAGDQGDPAGQVALRAQLG